MKNKASFTQNIAMALTLAVSSLGLSGDGAKVQAAESVGTGFARTVQGVEMSAEEQQIESWKKGKEFNVVRDSGPNMTKTDFCGSHDLLIETFINKLGEIQDVSKIDKKDLYKISILLEKFQANKMPVEQIIKATIPGIVAELGGIDKMDPNRPGIAPDFEQAVSVLGYGPLSRAPYGMVMRVEHADEEQRFIELNGNRVNPDYKYRQMLEAFRTEVQKQRTAKGMDARIPEIGI